MSSLPPAIVFINGDITYPPVPPPTPPVYIGSVPANPQSDATVSELTNLEIQLFIDDTMTKAEFDARVTADPNYPTIIHLRGMRILVILPTFRDDVNRELADVVIFLHQGLADVECNRLAWPGHGHPAVGPPGQSYPVQRLNIYELLRAAGSHNVVILPFWAMPHCEECNYPFYCDRCHTFSGIKICSKCSCGCKCGCGTFVIDNQGIKASPLYLPNCDSEYHNRNFINRK